ncbi:hypothetical protein ACDP63_16685 [Paracoccus sp. P2]|uniref:hypothetical protein n=1 Tax=Paracoccus sp. P2 TaxID=3248840 RepID=UPI00391FC105
MLIDLGKERERREAALNGPDSNCIVRDSEGRPMLLFAIDWHHDGRRWTVQIAAYDWEDAEARVASMRASLEVSGQVVAQGSAPWYMGQSPDV